MASTRVKKVAAHAAPGQYLGFSLQTTRLLARALAAADDATVGLECLDDVSVQESDGKVSVEQSKSALAGNPVSDHGIGLWKSLGNWLGEVKAGRLDAEKASFDLYVSKPVSGGIVESFSSARSIEEARRALADARTKLWGAAPKYPLRAKVGKDVSPHIEKVLDENEDAAAIIKNLSLICGSGSPQQDLAAQFSKMLVPPEILDETIKFSLGEVKKQTDLLLEAGRPALIAVGELRKTIRAFVRAYDRRTMLASFAAEPAADQVDQERRMRIYVRQLEFIESDLDDVMTAISDYLKASYDRVQWGEKGFVTEASFTEFEKTLERTWDNLKKKVDLAYDQKSETEKGKLLYHECLSYEGKLEGLVVPSHFTPGSFHSLADAPKIGWHADYAEKLDQLKKKEKPS